MVWFTQQLNESLEKNQSVFIFMHHNPLPLVQLESDYLGLLERDEFQLILNKFPDTIYSIIEKINVNLLKYKYSEQSDILIGKYSIDINSRLIRVNDEILKLTEKEIEIILFYITNFKWLSAQRTNIFFQSTNTF